MAKKIVVAIFIIISFVALDIFSRFLYAQSWFSKSSFSKELNPFEIITLVVSTLVTIWLGIYISKKLTEQRYQKEYIIKDIKLLEDEIDFFERKTLESSLLDLQESINSINKIKNYSNRFSKSLKIFDITGVDIKTIDKCLDKLYDKVTNLEGPNIVLNETYKNEINIICGDFVLAARKIVCSINKH